jgi:AraC family transcriptional regulator
MNRFIDRKYFIVENSLVYFSNNINKTIEWFEKILGWYGNIVEKDSNGNGLYEYVFSITPEIEITHLAHSNGIHIFSGEPKKGLVAFLQINGIQNMYDYVRKNNYYDISEIIEEPWGAKTCIIKTIDGYQLKFFEPQKK